MTYRSCWWLQDHIEFGLTGGAHACCYGFSDSKGQTRGHVMLSEIIGDRFPAEEIRAARARIHDQIAQNTNDDCRECAHIKLAEWPKREYLAKFLTINVWSHCNLKCTYCYTSQPNFKPIKVNYNIQAVVADMLSGRYLAQDGQVTWGGGDISALPEFNDISDLFIEYGASQEYKTSGFKYLRSVATALSLGRGFVEVSVDAGTPESYASVKGVDAYERVIENITRYREAGEVSLKYIADFSNLSDRDIDGFTSVVSKIRPQIVTITPEYESAWNNKFGPEQIVSMAKLIHAVRATGVTTVPGDNDMGEKLFPRIWSNVRRELDRLADTPLPEPPPRGLLHSALVRARRLIAR